MRTIIIFKLTVSLYLFTYRDLKVASSTPEVAARAYIPGHIRSNQPTRIADRFTNLFDVEWADAFEQVCRNRIGVPEVKIIVDLADILKVKLASPNLILVSYGILFI